MWLSDTRAVVPTIWIAQLLPPPEGQSMVWKTRHQLPPDCAAGTYCCKIQRTTVDGRVFKLASAQYISLSCVLCPVLFLYNFLLH